MADIVRIELVSTAGWTPEKGMHSYEAAEIWLADTADVGRVQRTRKPAARLVDESRPGVLRQLADWIEAKQDPALTGLADAIGQARG